MKSAKILINICISSALLFISHSTMAQTFPGGVSGDEKQVIEQEQIGAIDIIRVSMTPVAAILPEINVFTLPYIFRDEDHMYIGQEIGDRLSASSKSRLIFLGWMDAGTRNLITKAPVTKAEDLKGMQIRVRGSPIALDTLKAMGALLGRDGRERGL